MLRVGLVGSRRILPAHVGCRVDLVGSGWQHSGRLDDHGDDHGALDLVSSAQRLRAARRSHAQPFHHGQLPRFAKAPASGDHYPDAVSREQKLVDLAGPP